LKDFGFKQSVVPSIKVNLISSSVGRGGVKVSFESDKIVMTKKCLFVGKAYCDQGLFVLHVSDIINEFGSISSTFIVDSHDMWHARLGHVNSSYVIKLQQLGLINIHE